jgi:hypothetical protein
MTFMPIRWVAFPAARRRWSSRIDSGPDPEAEENRPPCMSWRTCCREYYLLEYDDATKSSWTFIRREPLFAIDYEKGEITSIQDPLGEFEE